MNDTSDPALNLGGPYFGYIDRTGATVVPLQYMDQGNYLFYYDHELSKQQTRLGRWNDRGTQLVRDAARKYRWGAIDRQGNYVIEPVCANIYPFSEGLAAALIANENWYENGMPQYRYGYINQHGEAVIPFAYSFASPFTNGLAAAVVDGKFGYLNQDGAWAVQPQYNMVFDFHDEGYAVVMPTVIAAHRQGIQASRFDLGYMEPDFFVYNYRILDREGRTVFAAEQLIKTSWLPDTGHLLAEYLGDPQRENVDDSGDVHTQTFEDRIIIRPYTMEILNAQDDEEGYLEFLWEFAPLDVVNIERYPACLGACNHPHRASDNRKAAQKYFCAAVPVYPPHPPACCDRWRPRQPPISHIVFGEVFSHAYKAATWPTDCRQKQFQNEDCGGVGAASPHMVFSAT